jgi:putative integral membrane protein (TIGR02587 family)
MSRVGDTPPSGADGGVGRSVGETARDFLHAVVGGLLIGLPLLWTQELWDQGAALAPQTVLLLFLLGFAIMLGFNALGGFRMERTWAELLLDATEGMGLSIVIAAVALLVLGRLGPDVGLDTIVSRIALQSVPIAFGTALAATILGEREEGDEPEVVGPLGRLVVAAGGAVFFALNFATTEEVRLLGSSADAGHLLLAIVGSLSIGLAVEGAEMLHGGGRARQRHGPLDGALGYTAVAYAVALLVSIVMLWAFGVTDGLGPRALIGHVVLLGIVASFGAATARLLVGGGPVVKDVGA